MRTSSNRHVALSERSMNLSGESVVVILLVGLVAGWLAGKIVTGWGFGDIAIGIVGALVGSWLFPRLGVHIGTGDHQSNHRRYSWGDLGTVHHWIVTRR